ncbi:MAG TPA: hypothetical protein VGN75_11805 [Kaistia sp.]|jgi:hypothetical protein|nr:hypothetical protein [Kaistia sp.]
MTRKPRYTVQPIHSPAGQVLLARRRVSVSELARAIAVFQSREGVRIGTLIGVTDDGLYAADREGWKPDRPDAFAEPLIHLPWVQIFEYLDRVPDGTTGDFLNAGRKHH